MMRKPALRLVPAPADTHDAAPDYLPRFPWRGVVLSALVFAIALGSYRWKEQRKAAALQTAILSVHETQLAPRRKAYLALREKVDGLVSSAFRAPTDTFIAPRFSLASLRSRGGLYLRLPLIQAYSASSIADGAKAMHRDVVSACLRLPATSARALYDQGAFLLPSSLDAIRETSDVMQLRVQKEVLSQHMRADLPDVLVALRADWLLLVLEESERPVHDAGVRVFVWDLAQGELRFRARMQPAPQADDIAIAEAIERLSAVEP
jgi:hypothetical protein